MGERLVQPRRGSTGGHSQGAGPRGWSWAQWTSQDSYCGRPAGQYRGGTGTTRGQTLSCPSGILAKTGLSGAKSMPKVMAKIMVQNGVCRASYVVSSLPSPPPATGPTGLLPISVGEGVGFTSSGAA